MKGGMCQQRLSYSGN